MELPTLEIEDLERWRTWLADNHGVSSGVWLVFHKVGARSRLLPYEGTVRQALCFGWIDSLIKRLDDDRYARKFTPRKSSSKWSDSNRKRWMELKNGGLLAPAGLAAAPTRNSYAPRPEIPELPDFVERAFRKNPKAWRFFRGLAPTYRRQFVAWICMAKRPETRDKRILESLSLLAAGKKLGLK